MVTPPSKGLANKDIDWLDTWKEMERVYLANKDKVRAIGVRDLSPYERSDYERPVDSILPHYRSPTSPFRT